MVGAVFERGFNVANTIL